MRGLTIQGKAGDTTFKTPFLIRKVGDVTVYLNGVATTAFTLTPHGHIVLTAALAVDTPVFIAEPVDRSGGTIEPIVLLAAASASGPVISNVPAGSYTFNVGGTFGGATVALKVLGPDGTTYETLVSKTAADTAGGTGIVLTQDSTIQATVTGGTGVSVSANLS